MEGESGEQVGGEKMPNNAVQTCYPTLSRSIHTHKVILLKTR